MTARRRSKKGRLEVGACSDTGIRFKTEEDLRNLPAKGYHVYTSIETALRENKVVTYTAGGSIILGTLTAVFRKPIGRGLKIGYDLASNLISRKKK